LYSMRKQVVLPGISRLVFKTGKVINQIQRNYVELGTESHESILR